MWFMDTDSVWKPMASAGGANVPMQESRNLGPKNTQQLADLRQYGAACDGSDVHRAVQAAIADGRRDILLPAGCTWVIPQGSDGFAIPAALHIYGESATYSGGDTPLSLITVPNPENTFLALGAYSMLENVVVMDAFCTNANQKGGVSWASATPNSRRKCPVRMAFNNSNKTQVFSTWPRAVIQAVVGADFDGTTDRQGMAISSSGDFVGDDYYAGIGGRGVGYRCASSGSGSQCFNAELAGTNDMGLQFRIKSDTATGLVYDIDGNGKAIQINDHGKGATQPIINYSTATRSAWPLLSVYHTASAWDLTDRGGMLYFHLNAENKGRVSGALIKLDIGTSIGRVTKWAVDAATGLTANGVGEALAVSAGHEIAVTHQVHHVGAGAIRTIHFPHNYTGCVMLIPDAPFTTGTTGNIAKASTAAIGQAMQVCYDGTKAYPSY